MAMLRWNKESGEKLRTDYTALNSVRIIVVCYFVVERGVCAFIKTVAIIRFEFLTLKEDYCCRYFSKRSVDQLWANQH